MAEITVACACACVYTGIGSVGSATANITISSLAFRGVLTYSVDPFAFAFLLFKECFLSLFLFVEFILLDP